jgi:hypothetical protein
LESKAFRDGSNLVLEIETTARAVFKHNPCVKLRKALSSRRAQKQISERAKNFAETLFRETVDEPITAKHKIG